MKLYASIVLATYGILASAFAGEDRNAVVRLHEIVLSEFSVKEAPLSKSLGIVRSAWEERYPDESFPVIVLGSFEHESDAALGATMDLKNVPALTVVTYLAQVHSMTVRHGLDLVVLRPVMTPDEGAWTSVMLSLSDTSVDALELSRESDGDETANQAIKKTLMNLGLSFDPAFEVRWFGGSQQLFVRNTPEEISKLKGLLMLFDAGYSVSKTGAENAGEQGDDAN